MALMIRRVTNDILRIFGDRFLSPDEEKIRLGSITSTDSMPKDSSMPLNEETAINPKGKFWIEAYGCSSSMNDSEIISGILRNEGYLISKTPYDSLVNIIVTCSVKDATEH